MSAVRVMTVGLYLLTMSSVWAATTARTLSQGMEAYMKEDYDKAVTLFDSVIKDDAANAVALSFKAESLRCLGKTTEALSACDAGLKMVPDCRMLLLYKAWCLQTLNYAAPAEQLIKEVMAGSPQESDWLGLVAQGIQNRALGKWKPAVEAFTRALKANPNDPFILNHRGMAYESDGQLDAAVSDYGAAIKSYESFYAAYNNRALLYSNIGKKEDALSDVQFLVDHKTRGYDHYFLRGVIYQSMNKHTEAIADFDRVLKEVPNYSPALSNRGASLVRNSEYVKARADFKRFLELDPLGPGAKDVREWLRLLDEQGL